MNYINQLDKPILILGNSIFALEVADLISEIADCKLAGFVENRNPERCKDTINGLPIYWVEALKTMSADYYAVCAIGSTLRTAFIEQVANYGMRFTSIVHPLSRISTLSTIGNGSIVSVGSIIASHTTIGEHVIINRGVLIGHHTTIGDYTTIGPGANIAGLCVIGKRAYIAMGSVIIERVTIGEHSVVGAGAVVVDDVPPRVQVIGLPAKIIKENINGR
jgi:sugar O-acyltransferase (sialic acid O-acetyltransferase NeuD family)